MGTPALQGSTSPPRRPLAGGPATRHRPWAYKGDRQAPSNQSNSHCIWAAPPPHTHTRAHPRLPGKLLVWHKCLLPQGAMGPVFASIDVKICQEFHSLLVKIHPQSVLLPSPGTPQSSVTSLASQWAPPASIARDSLEKEHCPALEGLPQWAPLRGPSPGLPAGSPWCQPWPGGPLVGPSDSWLGLISSLLPSYPNPLLS